MQSLLALQAAIRMEQTSSMPLHGKRQSANVAGQKGLTKHTDQITELSRVEALNALVDSAISNKLHCQ